MASITPRLLQDMLAGRETPSTALALDTLRKHPTCVLPAALCLHAGAPDATADERRSLIHAAALGCADRIAMADMADLSGQDWASMYPPIDAPKQTTNDAINVFIETYGHASPEEDALLEKLIFNPVAPDYFQGADVPYNPADPLALPPELMPGGKKTEHDAAHCDEKPKAEPITEEPGKATTKETEPEPVVEEPEKPAETHEEPSLMESLSKIYIKQRRYDRALEIINNLSLKYPEKSVYFADQIRFLRKLVTNQRLKEASAQG